MDDIIEPKLGQAIMILEEMVYSKNPPVFDFIFIDANKSEYIKYFKLIHPMLKKAESLLQIIFYLIIKSFAIH